MRTYEITRKSIHDLFALCSVILFRHSESKKAGITDKQLDVFCDAICKTKKNFPWYLKPIDNAPSSLGKYIWETLKIPYPNL